MFRHTSKEKGMWRGWLANGQSLEITWPRSSVALRLLIHSNDCDEGDRMLNVGLGFVGFYIPLGISRKHYAVGDEPSWGFDLSREFGINLYWGQRRRSFNWPFHIFTYAYEYMDAHGTWRDIRGSWAETRHPLKETYSYDYRLNSGEIQKRSATVHRRRHVLARHILHRLGWPKRIKESIDVEFDDEVGERSGSWKGGCIGCDYDLRKGETMLDALRRMERDRKF